MSEKQKKISSTKKINKNTSNKVGKVVSGYGEGSVDVVMSVDQVAKEAASMSASAPTISALSDLASQTIPNNQ